MDRELKTERPDAEPVTGEEKTVSPETAPADAGQGEAAPARLSWEQILEDPEYRSRYDAAIQGIVKARLKTRAQAEAKLARLAPVLAALEEDYGLTEEGDTAPVASRLRESAGLRRPSADEVAAHLGGLLAQAEALRESVPDFDLLQELEDPDFLRLTAPHSGVKLADAFYARHRVQREQAAARRGLEAVSRSLLSGGARPKELRETAAGARFSQNPAQMSRAEREALKKRILEARAEGRRIGPGE